MLATIGSILIAILIIGVIIMVHEFGHYMTGKKLGFAIEEFSIGFGPKLFRWEKNGIQYTIRALPIGGYVQFLGEDEENENPRAFNNQPKWKRFLTLFSGAFNNILLAILLSITIIFAFGEYAPQIVAVTEGSPAQVAGFQPGDIIKNINGNEIYFQQEASEQIKPAEGTDTVTIVVERNGERITLTSGFSYNEAAQRELIGISIGGVRVYYSLWEAFLLSFRWMFLLFKEMIVAIFQLLTFQQSLDAMMGTVGIISMMGQAVRSSFETVLRIAMLITLNLGVFNLIPFPALDGGRIALLGIEAIRKKPISRKVEAAVNLAGLVVLMGLIVVLTYNDIARIIAPGG